jgi:hypothetical protein
MTRTILPICLLAMISLSASWLPANEIYIGNAASSGSSFTSSNRADSASNLTYIFSSDSYTAAGITPVEFNQVNFYTGAGGAGQTVTPFVALYNGGDPSNGNSFALLLQGDPITAVSGLNNAAFTVGGKNPVVNLPSGDVLVSGEFQTGQVVYFDPGSVSDVDIYFNNVIPGVGDEFPASPPFVFTAQKYWFDIGFEIVPEPSSVVALCGLGAMSLFLVGRHRRKD